MVKALENPTLFDKGSSSVPEPEAEKCQNKHHVTTEKSLGDILKKLWSQVVEFKLFRDFGTDPSMLLLSQIN